MSEAARVDKVPRRTVISGETLVGRGLGLDEAEDDRFETIHLPTAVELGGDWSDAKELQEASLSVLYERFRELTEGIVYEEQLPPFDTIDADGITYHKFCLLGNVALIGRFATTEERCEQVRSGTVDADKVGLPMFFVLAVAELE